MSARQALLAAVVLAAGPLLGTVPAIPSAAADPCPDIEVVFARGTTEPPGVGHVGQAFVDSLRSQVGGRSVGVYAVNYPATDDFVNSASAGVNDARAHLDAMVASCPNTRMVLGGYSQGASVINGVTATTAPQVADHVGAVALFGNPKTAFADSLAPGPLPAISPPFAPKTIDLCVPNDPICTAGNSWAAHVSYVQTGMTNQAATFAASRL